MEFTRKSSGQRLARKRDYPIIRFLVIVFHVVAVLSLLLGLVCAGYLWLRAELLRDGIPVTGAWGSVLSRHSSSDLLLAGAAAAGVGLVLFLAIGALGQFLAMQRDRAVNSANQVRLLEDILELNEQLGAVPLPATSPDGSPSASAVVAAKTKRVELCEGCGRLGSLHRIDSGQWVCRECRRQLRSADPKNPKK